MVPAPDDAPTPDDGEGDDAGDPEPADGPADEASASNDGPATDPASDTDSAPDADTAPEPDSEPTPDDEARSPPSTVTDAADRARSARRPVLADYLGTGTERTLRLVLGITVLALVARFVLLGDRVQHFDEGRVAWWTLEYMRTSSFEYRYIIHGPFIQHLNTFLFSVLGTTDFATRVVPALVGGLLPASALLFREHLRRSELVALALFLSFNPILLYYSRFSRSTILVAGFAFVAFGFLVRAMDARRATRAESRPRAGREAIADGGAATTAAPTSGALANVFGLGRTRSPALYVHVAVLFFGLAFAAKENALVYLLCWMGASALVADRLLSAPGESGFDRVEAVLERFVLHPGYYIGHALLALLILNLVTVFFYAPRGAAAPNGIGLYATLTQPSHFPALLDATTADVQTGLDYWFGGSTDPGCNKDNLIDGYACYLGRFLESMALYAGPLFVLSVVGFLADRYTDGRPRALVMFAAFWGFASVLGYPLGTDIYGAWIVVNALVPLAIPAAVGAALLYRWGVDAYREDDGISLLLVLVLALVATGATGYQGATGVYVSPEEGPDSLVQYAQPEGEWRPIIEEMQALSAGNPPGEDDVLVHGSYYVDGDSSAVRTPACIKWFKALPMPWYFEKDGMQVTCTNLTADLPPQESMPPVVISRTTNADALEERLGDDYRKEVVMMRRGAISTVVFIDESAPRADIQAPRADVQAPADTREAVRDARADRARLRAELRSVDG